MAGIGGQTPNTVQRFTDSTTNLAAAATFTGTSRATGGNSRFRVKVVADQALTVTIDQSIDGTTWDSTIIQSIPANTPSVLESIINDPNIRTTVKNAGGSTTTVLRVSSVLVAV